MATTAVTLTNGRVLEVAGAYDDMRRYLTTGERREVTLTDGRQVTLATGLVGLIEQSTQRRAVGFR
jgi:ferric-dicitrate binding protein FerR (iron transport regulator)